MRESRLVSPLFLAAVFCATFEKVHWNVAGTVYLADVTTLAVPRRLGARPARPTRSARPAHRGRAPAASSSRSCSSTCSASSTSTRQQAADQFGKGIVKWLIHFVFLDRRRHRTWPGARARYYWRTLAWFFGGITFNALYGILQLARRAGGPQPRLVLRQAADARREPDQHLRRGRGIERLPAERAHRRPEPPRDHAARAAARARADLPAARAAPSAAAAARVADRAAAARRADDALAQRAARARVGALVLAVPYRHLLWTRAAALPLVSSRCPCSSRSTGASDYFETVVRSRIETSGRGTSAHFGVYGFIPGRPAPAPALRARLQQLLRLLRVRHRQDELGAALVLRRAARGGRPRRDAAVRRFLLYVLHRLGVARRIGRALAAAGNPEAARVRPLAWGMTAALLGTMAANAFYLTLSFFYFFVFAALALATPIVFGAPSLTPRSPSFERR